MSARIASCGDSFDHSRAGYTICYMKQKILYSVIVLLLGVLAWQQMYRSPSSAIETSGPIGPEEDFVVPDTTYDSAEVSEGDKNEVDTESAEVVTVTGTYVGLRDEVGGDFAETSMYLLLDDGT